MLPRLGEKYEIETEVISKPRPIIIPMNMGHWVSHQPPLPW